MRDRVAERLELLVLLLQLVGGARELARPAFDLGLKIGLGVLQARRHGVEFLFGQSNPPSLTLACADIGIRQIGYRQENAGSYMASLKDSQGAAFCTWIYCILWWLIQDAFKVYTYFLLDQRSEQGSWSAALGAQWDIINGRAPPPPAKSFKNPLPGATAGAKDGARPTSADW